MPQHDGDGLGREAAALQWIADLFREEAVRRSERAPQLRAFAESLDGMAAALMVPTGPRLAVVRPAHGSGRALPAGA